MKQVHGSRGWIARQPNEARVAEAVGGNAMLDALYRATLEFYAPIPVANASALVYRGGLLPIPSDDRRARAATLHNPFRPRKLAHAAGFVSLSDLISEATAGGKRQDLSYSKAGVTGVVARSNSLWGVGAWPAIGAAGGATGTGAVRTRTTVGALQQQNAAGGDQLHIIGGTFQASIGTQMLLIYDRLWDMTHTMTVDPRSNDAANVPTRYQTAPLAPGSFISGEVTTVLPAATPTISFTYVDQDGNDVTGPAFSTIASSAAVGTVPFTAGPWFYPLDPADVGVRALANNANAVDLSAAMASGVVTWFIGHPLLIVPLPTANVPVLIDGINSAFNLNRIYDDACIALLELVKGVTTATNHWGMLQLASG